MRKVYLHIGLPKTATSSVQAFLYGNKKFLNKNGLRYVQTGLSKNLKCHHDLMWKLGLHQGPSYVENDIQRHKGEVLKQLSAENRKYQDKDFIVSSELLTFLGDYTKLIDLLNVFKDREVVFLLTLREQGDFLESLYQQVVKDGCEQTFEEWFVHAKNVADYSALIDKVLMIADIKNVRITAFDTKKSDFNPVVDFLRMVGVGTQAIEQKKIQNEKDNESLSNKAVELVRLSNELKLGINYFLVDKLNMQKHTKARFLDDKQQAAIKEYFYDSNLQLINKLENSQEIEALLMPHTFPPEA